MDEIKAEEVGKLLRGRMGLILGPAITKFPGSFGELSVVLAGKGGVEPGEHYIETCDAVLDNQIPESELKDWVRACVADQARSSLLVHLAKAKWSAVLSASLDSEFEDRFQQEGGRRVAWPSITILTDLLRSPPPGTLPVFKLLGVAARDDFAFSTPTYISRRATWRHAVKGFGDLVKGNPVLCLGMSDCPWLLFDVIGEILADPSAMPSSILLLADDPLCANSRLPQLLRRRGRLVKVQGTVGDVARAVVAQAKQGYGLGQLFPEPADDPYHDLRPYHDMVTVVNDQVTSKIAVGERNRLLDLLFAPSVACWDPFAHELDFQRTVTAALTSRLISAFKDKPLTEGAVAVTGAAASGKSTVIKRAAYEVARTGPPVLWLKPWFYQDAGHALGKVFQAVAKITQDAGRKALVVMDDPSGFGSVTPRDVVTAARSADVTVQLLVAVRTSEWGTTERPDLVGGLPVLSEHKILDDLDDDEWSRLGGYLVKLGVVPDHAAAAAKLDEAMNRAASDTLSTLYWLLPETRANIASSIRDEYNRLGDMAGLRKVILGTVKHSTELLRRAYEMVAVADHQGAAVPIEVLVSALGVDYGAWRDATQPASGAWGLFYDDESEEKDTICFHVRNAVVTRFVVEAVNGGSFGHSGEVRVLNNLLSACTGRSSPVYREFCVRVLVPYHKIKKLGYEEGLGLYEAAITALPHQDRTLVHHKGLWIKNVGHDPARAKEVLTTALATRVYPYTNRPEAEEHIHTSLAATTLDEIDRGQCRLEEGKQIVLEHLAKARSLGFFNAKPVHVQANLILRLAEKEESAASPDYVVLINRAIADVDHTLLLLESQVRETREAVTDIQMLEEVRSNVLAKTVPLDALKAEAQRLWDEFQSQEGFVLVGRKMFAEALTKDKRYNLAFHQCDEYMGVITAAGVAVSPALYEVALHIYYYWRVRRSTQRPGGHSVEWPTIRDLSRGALQSVQSARNPLLRHIHALSLAHLGDWPAANAIYTQMRQEDMPNHIKFAGRDYLLNEQGGPRRVQGEIKSGADRMFLVIEDLGIDLLADRRSHWPRPGEIAHAYVRFSFAGPIAVDRV